MATTRATTTITAEIPTELVEEYARHRAERRVCDLGKLIALSMRDHIDLIGFKPSRRGSVALLPPKPRRRSARAR